MKKKLSTQRNQDRSAIAVPTEIKNEFRKLCVIQDLKPSAVAQRLFTNWIEKEKKKVTYSLTANG